MQGLQNRMFAIFMATVLSTALMHQIQPRFVQLSDLYAVREKPSKMYHWSTFVLANVIIEVCNDCRGSVDFSVLTINSFLTT